MNGFFLKRCIQEMSRVSSKTQREILQGKTKIDELDATVADREEGVT